jgi:hypothetical protein
VATPPPAVVQKLSLEDLYALKGERFVQAQALDQLRKRDTPGGEETSGLKREALACFVGPVVRTLDGNAAESVQLDTCVDLGKKTVKSPDGRQVQLDWGAGVLRVNTPRCKAACGFLGKAGPTDLDGVKIECQNEYASIIVISLDEKPIAESRKVLVQAMTEERPLGFRAEGGKVAELGGPPFGVRKIQAKVTLPWDVNSVGAKRPVALDENGYITDKPVKAVGGPKYGIELAPDAIYYVLER